MVSMTIFFLAFVLGILIYAVYRFTIIVLSQPVGTNTDLVEEAFEAKEQEEKQAVQAEFLSWSKHDKKHALITIPGGKRVKAWKWLQLIAGRLPKMKIAHSNRLIDHLDILKSAYYEKGVAGVQEYLDIVGQRCEELALDQLISEAVVNTVKKDEHA